MADTALAMPLLAEAVAADPKGKAGVAWRLNVSRALLSRVLSPNDPTGMSAKLAQRVIDCYHVVPACPYNGLARPRSECRRLALGPAPTHNPLAMQIWKTCQSCPHKPEKPR